MPTNREAYFKAIKLNVPQSVVYFALQEINGFNYLQLTEHFDGEIKDNIFFETAIKRYLNGEMIEYIFNKTMFLSLPFYVDKNVLIPRQETEQLVLRTKELIKEMFGEKQVSIADVCTGSGAIGLSLKNMLPNNRYYLTDISKEAIRVCKINADRLSLNQNITLLQGDMLKPLIDKSIKVDVIVCNPPYIEDETTIDEKTFKQEPHLALIAKPNTLYYEEVFKNAGAVLNNKYLMSFEIGEDMENRLSTLVEKYFPHDEFFFEKDIYGKTRFLFIKHQ